MESRAYTVVERELYKEERDLLEGKVWKVNERDMMSFGTLDSTEKTIARLGYEIEDDQRRRHRKRLRFLNVFSAQCMEGR